MSIRTIHALGVRLTISSDVDELLEQFLTVFCAFIGTASPDDGNTDITVMIRDAEGLYDDGRRKVRLAPGRWRAPHVYNLLYTTLVRAFDTVYLLHAAVVAGDGRAWLIGGPSGSGKSSLCRALIDRGYELLSDDLAPLSLADGLVHPFPRRLGLVRDVGRPDPAGALRLGEKLFVTAEQMGLRMATVALPPGGVVLMNPYDPGGSTVEITLGLVGDPAALRARLIAEPGVVLSRSRTEGDLSELTLVVQGASAIAHLERELERADDELLFHFRSYGSDKTYAATPALRPITVREATFGLLQEMLNREPGSALMRRLRRKASGAVIELMGALGGVPCFQLEPSGIESTAALLARTFKALKQVGDRPAPP
jgi:hypothetical protein